MSGEKANPLFLLTLFEHAGPAGWGNESMQSMRVSDLLFSQLMLCLKASAPASITHKGDICPRGP